MGPFSDASTQRLTPAGTVSMPRLPVGFQAGPDGKAGRWHGRRSGGTTRYDPRDTPGGVCDRGSMRHPLRAAPDVSSLKSGDRFTLDLADGARSHGRVLTVRVGQRDVPSLLKRRHRPVFRRRAASRVSPEAAARRDRVRTGAKLHP